jgi:hypothetical protein
MKIVIFPSKKKNPKTFFKKISKEALEKQKNPRRPCRNPGACRLGRKGRPLDVVRLSTPNRNQKKEEKFSTFKKPGERNRGGVVNGRKDHHTCHLVVLALKKKKKKKDNTLSVLSRHVRRVIYL